LAKETRFVAFKDFVDFVETMDLFCQVNGISRSDFLRLAARAALTRGPEKSSQNTSSSEGA